MLYYCKPKTINQELGTHSIKSGESSSAKTYTKKDMERALDALRSRQMSLSKAAESHGIPATTLWQRANKMGIAVVGAANQTNTSKTNGNKEAAMASTGSSSTASTSPVAAAPPNKNWSEEDLNSALEALRKKEISANKAAKVC